MATTNPKIPIVQDGLLRKYDGQRICRVGPHTGWFDWLQRPTTKSFRYFGASGQHCTVCKEKRIGNSGNTLYYFIAYRSIKGKKKRVYLGKAEDVTLLALEEAAGQLAQLALEAERRGAQAQTAQPLG